MRTDPAAGSAFSDYRWSLVALEKTIREAGSDAELSCYIGPLGKMVGISDSRTLKILKNVCIEGDSPMQALRDVLAGVPL
jgi:hypothetical protein